MTEIRVRNALTGGEKGSKPARYDLIPVRPLKLVAEVYGKGAEKYAERNWERGYEWHLSYAALQRHLNAFWGGEDLDDESNLPHLAHAIFHCLALIEWGYTHPELDDRPKVGIQTDSAPGICEVWGGPEVPETDGAWPCMTCRCKEQGLPCKRFRRHIA